MPDLPPLNTTSPIKKRGWRNGFLALVGLIAIGAMIIEYRARQRRLILEDGRTLTLVHAKWVQPGESHQLANPANNRLTRAWGELVGKPLSVASAGIGYDHDYRALGLWFDLPGGWTPNDALTKTPVLTDANGWKHELYINSTSGGAKPYALCEIPPVDRANEQCRLDMVSTDGKVLGSMNYTMPHDTKPFFEWTASPLPITVQNGEMAVTLNGMTVVDSFRNFHFVYRPGIAFVSPYGVQPEFAVLENGQPSSDWELCDDSWWNVRKRAAPVRNTSGERSSISRCVLSPYDDVWKFDLALVKKLATLPPERKIEFQCQIPAANSSIVVTQQQNIGPTSVTILGVAGAGHSTITAKGPRFYPGTFSYPMVHAQQSKITISTLEMPGNSGFGQGGGPIVNDDFNMIDQWLRPAQLTLSFEQPVQTIVLNATPWKSEHLQVEVFDEQGRPIAGQKMRFMEVALWMPQSPLRKEIQTVTVRVSVQEPRHSEFFVTPPRQLILDHLARQDSSAAVSTSGKP